MAASAPMPMVNYNPANFVRTVKLRSDLDATFKPSYNRMQFSIPSDDLSTDLSQSYLALRMYLTHASTGLQYTKADLIAMAAVNTYVSFGQNGQSYSPACLVKLCRLFNGNMQILEETNFNNVLAETLAQITGDFESVGSSSLTSNTSVVFGQPQSLGASFANILPDAVGTGEQVPIEVHLPLHKLFGFFKNKNCYLNDPALSGSGGTALHIHLELEDRAPLLQSITMFDSFPCPRKQTGGIGGLEYSLAANPYCSLTAQNSNGQATELSDVSGAQPLVPTNATLDPSGNQYIFPPPALIIQNNQINSFFDANPATPTDTLVIGGTWNAQTVEYFGIEPDSWIKLNFRLSAIGSLVNQRQDQIVSRFAQIDASGGVISGAGLTITLQNTFVQTVSTLYATTLDTVEFFTVARSIELEPIDTAGMANFRQKNQMIVGTATLNELKVAGLVTTTNGPTNSPFVLNVQTVGTVNGVAVPVEPFFDQFLNPDVPSVRQMISNNAQKLPIQGSSCRIIDVADIGGGDFRLTFNNLGLFNDNSLQAAFIEGGQILYDDTLSGGDPVTANYQLIITNMSLSGNTVLEDDFSYAIDKAELVLVQQAKDKSIPMSRVYSTWRVEVATIETQLPIYQRQFLVTEPNCYSILMCMPQYSTATTPLAPGTTAFQPQSLISFNRGCQSYRWSINNIDDTNRDLEVQTNSSYYPSSLHVEKLMDAIANDGHKVKSLSGLLTVPHSANPVVCLPLKVYNARQGANFVMKPEGYQAQITLIGDVNHNQPITPGPIFLFKHCLRMI